MRRRRRRRESVTFPEVSGADSGARQLRDGSQPLEKEASTAEAMRGWNFWKLIQLYRSVLVVLFVQASVLRVPTSGAQRPVGCRAGPWGVVVPPFTLKERKKEKVASAGGKIKGKSKVHDHKKQWGLLCRATCTRKM